MMKNKRKYYFLFLIVFLLSGCSDHYKTKEVNFNFDLDSIEIEDDSILIDGSFIDTLHVKEEHELLFFIDGDQVELQNTIDHQFHFCSCLKSGKHKVEIYYQDNLIYHNEIKIYADELDQFIDLNIKDTMSEYDKMKVFINYVLTFPYNYDINNYKEMLEKKSGECFANSDLLIELCKRVGIKATAHTRNNDLSYPDFHVNVVCLLDGQSYMVDCGHVDRTRFELEKTKGFSYRLLNNGTIAIEDLDGYYETIEIPEKINGYTVSALLPYSCKDHYETKKIIIPETVKMIGEYAFVDCIMLKEIECLSYDLQIASNAFQKNEPIMLGNTPFPLEYSHETIQTTGNKNFPLS